MFTLQTKLSMLKALVTKNRPFYIQFYVSKECHLKCKMCNIVEANCNVTAFRTNEIEQIADNLVKIGAGVILLTGGEPFMREDIDEIVRIFKQKKLDVRLQTAGLYSRRDKIAQCVKYGARDINVTLHSLDKQLADYIYGVNGAWENAIKTVSFISQTLQDQGSFCAFGCVLSKYNVDEIEAILDLATQIGWWLSLVPVHITTPDKPMNFRGYDQYFEFDSEGFKKVEMLIETLKKKKREGYLLFDSDDYLDSMCHFIKTGVPHWRHKNICDSPNLYFAILPDARFTPCCDYRLDEDIYVYDPDFPRIYASRALREKVKLITQECSGCNFGSYPEMTLSARSLSTLKERIMLADKISRTKIKSIEERQLFRMIAEIKEKYDIYKKERRK
ncbi:radical SAM protein [Candidatus Omnitrophota bacterium]